MARNIFIVDAYLVTAEGVFSHFQNFPKSYDSNNSAYGTVDVALKRATEAFADAWSGFCSADADGRQIQSVTLTDISGNQLDKKCVGSFPVEPEPEAE